MPCLMLVSFIRFIDVRMNTLITKFMVMLACILLYFFLGGVLLLFKGLFVFRLLVTILDL